MQNQIHALCALLLFFVLPWAQAETEDSDNLPVHITSDHYEFIQKTNTWIYEGNVKLTRGSLVLLADKLTAYSKLGELQHVIANGQPARLTYLTDNNEKISGHMQTLDYQRKQGEMILSGNVFLKQISQDGKTSSTHSDKAHIFLDSDNEIQEVIAHGMPARYQQERDNQSNIHGQGQLIEYFAKRDMIFFSKHAELKQDNHDLKANRIEYNIATESGHAFSDGGQRAHMTYQPGTQAQ